MAHIEEIKRLKSRYCRFIDSRQWDRLRELFTAEVRLEGFTIIGGNGTTFVDDLARRLKGAITAHQCHTPEIRLTGANSAEGVWAMMDLIEWPHPVDLKTFSGATGFYGTGFYEERYHLDDGRWRIAFMRLTRTRFEPLINGARPSGFDVFAGLGGFTPPSRDWMC
ncbi:nuclear transport factor 2 family protein [Bradyrhizobium pachyrhizi]|uniref:nuclear transport factor 2 family protein n=1 Tax=Bradyrhizobium pachyrhizi TaxID=280333 RepID=UPI003D35EA4C